MEKEPISLVNSLKDPNFDINQVIGKRLRIGPLKDLTVKSLEVSGDVISFRIKDCPYVDIIIFNTPTGKNQFVKGISAKWDSEEIFVG
ncbi:hypothetical protein KKC45_02185 [Patescibacteria group bacterium]|nr:hypothetical protein [Patescibacteria group bacterium]